MEETVGAIFSQGQQSIKIPVPVYIRASASVAGTKEGQGPLGLLFDMIGEDDMFGKETWEDAESSLQKDAVYMALSKAGLEATDMDLLFNSSLTSGMVVTP